MKKIIGANIWKTEKANISIFGKGEVLNKPISCDSNKIYGWATKNNGDFKKVTFSGNKFSIGGIHFFNKICEIYYYTYDACAKCVEINANDDVEEVKKYIPDIKLNNMLNSEI